MGIEQLRIRQHVRPNHGAQSVGARESLVTQCAAVEVVLIDLTIALQILGHGPKLSRQRTRRWRGVPAGASTTWRQTGLLATATAAAARPHKFRRQGHCGLPGGTARESAESKARVPHHPHPPFVRRTPVNVEILAHHHVAIEVHRQVVECQRGQRAVDVHQRLQLGLQPGGGRLSNDLTELNQVGPIVGFLVGLLLPHVLILGFVLAKIVERRADIGLVKVAGILAFAKVILKKIAVHHFTQHVEPVVLVINIKGGVVHPRSLQAKCPRRFVVKMFAHEARVIEAVAQIKRADTFDLLALHKLVQLDAERLLVGPRAEIGAIALKTHTDGVKLVGSPFKGPFQVSGIDFGAEVVLR